MKNIKSTFYTRYILKLISGRQRANDGSWHHSAQFCMALPSGQPDVRYNVPKDNDVADQSRHTPDVGPTSAISAADLLPMSG